MEKRVEEIVIVGSGPAAWTAATYAARARLDPLVFEGAPSREMIPGGQLMFTTEVENYPGFPDGVDGQSLMLSMRAQAVRFVTRIATDDIVKLDAGGQPFILTSAEGTEVRARAVVVATGARANWLGLKNERRLAETGGGVSACAVCDGALPAFRNQVLAVVGGGDSAMEEATYLTKFAKEVVIIHRRDAFRASPIMVERVLKNEKIRVEWNAVVTEVLGDDFVTGIRVRNGEAGEERVIEVGGFFVAIGHTPNTGFLKGVVTLDDKGYVVTAKAWRTETSVPGIFAAGDVMDPYYRQAITAAGTGCMAALEAERWLSHASDEAGEKAVISPTSDHHLPRSPRP
ncbi:MAG: thioredoxin-disulfide reductase [Gemmatimonadetes bacterium]|nr:thioredoxin-disulfide reductase [Gemmatimonadota bacterium]